MSALLSKRRYSGLPNTVPSTPAAGNGGQQNPVPPYSDKPATSGQQYQAPAPATQHTALPTATSGDKIGACEPCRLSKMKCDGAGQTCSRCKQKGEEASCEFKPIRDRIYVKTKKTKT